MDLSLCRWFRYSCSMLASRSNFPFLNMHHFSRFIRYFIRTSFEFIRFFRSCRFSFFDHSFNRGSSRSSVLRSSSLLNVCRCLWTALNLTASSWEQESSSLTTDSCIFQQFQGNFLHFSYLNTNSYFSSSSFSTSVCSSITTHSSSQKYCSFSQCFTPFSSFSQRKNSPSLNFMFSWQRFVILRFRRCLLSKFQLKGMQFDFQTETSSFFTTVPLNTSPKKSLPNLQSPIISPCSKLSNLNSRQKSQVLEKSSLRRRERRLIKSRSSCFWVCLRICHLYQRSLSLTQTSYAGQEHTSCYYFICFINLFWKHSPCWLCRHPECTNKHTRSDSGLTFSPALRVRSRMQSMNSSLSLWGKVLAMMPK